jgi:hypothetical protein
MHEGDDPLPVARPTVDVDLELAGIVRIALYGAPQFFERLFDKLGKGIGRRHRWNVDGEAITVRFFEQFPRYPPGVVLWHRKSISVFDELFKRLIKNHLSGKITAAPSQVDV